MKSGKALSVILCPATSLLLSMLSLIYGSHSMDLIEELAEAALQRDSLRLRSLVQDMTRAHTNGSSIPRPSTKDARALVMAASLTELLATRQNQTPPSWTKEIGALSEP